MFACSSWFVRSFQTGVGHPQRNQQSHFDVGSDHIKYFVREVVSNGLRPPCRNRQGRHKSVTIRSRGWDPTMTLDGIHTYPLPAGQRAHFDTDPSVALRTCRFE